MKFKLGFARPAVAVGPQFNQSRKANRQVARFMVPALAILLALFLGLAAAILPWQFLVGIAGLPLLLLIGLAAPLPVFVISLLLLLGIVPEFIVAALPLGGASLRPPELMLIFLAILTVVRAKASGVDIFKPLIPMWPLIAVLICGVFLGFIKGKILSHNVLALADLRGFVGWLALPISAWFSIVRPVAFRRIIVGISLFASVLMIGQLATGVQLIYGFRGAEALSKEFDDVTRSAIGSGLILLGLSAYLIFLKMCDGPRIQIWDLLSCALIVGAIVSSFNRGVWAGFFIGAIFLLVVKPKTARRAFFPVMALSGLLFVGATVIFVVKPRVADAVLGRIFSLQTEGAKGTSLGFRFDENSQALVALKASPLLGVGMGGEYKKTYRQTGVGGGFGTENSFIHNGYLSLWLKMGLFGLLFPAALMFVVYKGSLIRSAGIAAYQDNSVKLSAIGAVLMMAISALTAPEWTALGGNAVLAIILAMLFTCNIRVNK